MSRVALNFNDGWKFKLGKNPKFETAEYKDKDWEDVLLPHDWSIYGVFKKDYETTGRGGYRPSGFGCYRKTFTVPKSYEGNVVEISFGGVYRKATLFVNGKRVYYWVNGWTTETVDISKYLIYGKKNVIALRADNSAQPASRYYTGCGIYRDVTLFVRNKLNIENFTSYITTPKISEKEATVNAETKVFNGGDTSQKFSIKYTILDAKLKAVAEYKSEALEVLPNKALTHKSDIIVKKPNLWSTETPYLYTLKTEIIKGKETADESSTRFGIRTILFDKDKGFFLNGKRTWIKGVCIHHDNGCLGAVANKEYERRKIETMVKMGVNAIRLSHNPVSESFLDLCDEYGIMVMDEFFDEWKCFKFMLALRDTGSPDKIVVENYHEYFDKWHKHDLSQGIIRDRNHPSVIMWSIGNEIFEQRHCIVSGEKIAKELKAIVKKYDKTRPVTCACCFDQKGADNTGFVPILDVAGYNYAEVLYELHHERFPKRTILGSETTSVAPFWKRNEYDFKVLSEINKRMDLKLGEALDSVSDRIRSAEFSMRAHRDMPFIAGFFIWTGVDYLGEPTPYAWPSRSSYFGVTDTCCFPKDSYYFYKSFWNEKETTLHLFPHWNLGKDMIGKKLNVIAYTNVYKAELFINGKSQGMKEYNSDFGEHINWEVKYEPGELKALGYNKKGELIATDIINTAGKPQKIEITLNKKTLLNDRRDILFAETKLLDENGNIVPDDDRVITYKIVGENGTVLGVDNGDPEYIGDLKADFIPTLHGLSLAVIGTNGLGGDFKLVAESDGLKPCTAVIKVK